MQSKSQMIHVVFVFMGIGLLVACGCRQQQDESKAPEMVTGQSRMADPDKPDQSRAVLTLEIAKQALIAMVENQDTPIHMKSRIAALRSAQGIPNEVYPDWIVLDSWSCNLSRQAFGFRYASEEEGVGTFSGKFKFRKTNKWEAVITKQLALCGPTRSVETTYNDEVEEALDNSESQETGTENELPSEE